MAAELQTERPLKVLVLPTGTSFSARICTLAHPRTEKPSRYYLCPEKGVFEFTRVAAPRSVYQSWLLAPQTQSVKPILGLGSGETAVNDLVEDYKEEGCHTTSRSDGEDGMSKPVAGGYVVKTPEFLVATPIDPLFLLLPFLQSKKLFLSAYDILDELCEASKHFKQAANADHTKSALENRMNVVCDVVEAGEEKMYRLNISKLLTELVVKATTMVTKGLPMSMEDRFINKPLETSVMGMKREQSSLSDAVGASQDDLSAPTPVPSECTDSQSNTAASESAASNSSTQTDLTVPDENPVSTAPDDIKHALRIRTALSYMISTYIPAALAATLNHQLSSGNGHFNFGPLDDHLAHIAKMRSEMLASRSLSDFSRKRSMNEDDEAPETRAEKKRKREEEEKRKKAGESRGIRDLKKVDTSGMKKMSDFFGKGVAAKKK